MEMTSTPISERDLLKQQEKDIRERWFKDHVVTVLCEMAYPDERAIKVIKWANPKSSNYRTIYVLHGGVLMVYGDIGEATYGWSQRISVEFLKGCDFHYFAGKCLASETGRGYEEFDSDVAAFQMDQYINDPENNSKYEQEAIALLREEKPECKDEFQRVAEQVYDIASDSELCSMICEWGTVPSIRCLGHWVGLKMMNL